MHINAYLCMTYNYFYFDFLSSLVLKCHRVSVPVENHYLSLGLVSFFSAVCFFCFVLLLRKTFAYFGYFDVLGTR